MSEPVSTNFENNFISDQDLPEHLDYIQLKQAALSYLQKINGHVWTNYNESDPGVTILEQLCYALTELGYCTDFPIEDLLTDEDGKIAYHNQFYDAPAILTSAPISLRDYQNLIFDKFPQVMAIYLQAEQFQQSSASRHTGRYVSRLALAQSDSQSQAGLLKEIHAELNQYRNLGEYFLCPKVLNPRVIPLIARLYLQQDADVSKVLAQIRQKLQDFVLPRPIQYSFQDMQKQGWDGTQIMNGPRLKNGWISSRETIQPNLIIRLTDLSAQISSVSGVAMLDGLGFTEAPGQDYLLISEDEYPQLLADSEFIFLSNHRQQKPEAGRYQSEVHLTSIKGRHQAHGVDAKVDITPALPVGRYRDIESYYSIQHTFPEIYAVGHNSLESDVASYRVGAARQLKAYLLVFDQILANQFSQTAHLPDLFAFTPRSKTRKKNSAWPVAEDFAQTYYWQTLYDIPDAKKLLRGSEYFNYQYASLVAEETKEKQRWERYIESPYNEYVTGLSKSLESQDEAEKRREKFLNHLLARQGYVASAFDAMLGVGEFYGTKRRSRIIAKTIWLQNEQLLSYHRYNAYDCWSARQLQDLASYEKKLTLAAAQPVSRKIETARTVYPLFNGELDLPKIWQTHKIRPQDLADFASLECRLDLMLGLRQYLLRLVHALDAIINDPVFMQWLLRDLNALKQIYLPTAQFYIRSTPTGDEIYVMRGDQSETILSVAASMRECAGLADYRQLITQLLWLAEQRHGFILLEPILLLNEQQVIDEQLAPYCLSCFLIFPDYVSRYASVEFQENLQKLLHQFAPFHLDIQVKRGSANFLKALIQSYTLWHNHPHSPALRQNYARQLQRLLQLPEVARGAHA